MHKIDPVQTPPIYASHVTTSDDEQDMRRLRARLDELERENARLRAGPFEPSEPSIVRVPPEQQALFDQVAVRMREHFRRIEIDPARGRIAIDDDRYLLVRASAFSIDFLDTLVQLYADRGESEALAIARGFLFDIAHTIGIHDAKQMHEKLGSRDPLEKLSGGPVHFAYTGWATVDIKPSSRPVPDESFLLVYEHPYSFEAASFVRAGRRSEGPVCIMNAGYSSGWCQQSFGVELTAVEVKCRARGDEGCFFVMAPPEKVAAAAREHFAVDLDTFRKQGFDVPTYFERKHAEEELRRSLRRLKEAQDEIVRKERLATVGLLVSGVAHEVNTPLGIAVTAVGVVEDELAKVVQKFDAGALTKGDFRAFVDRAGQAVRMVEANLGRAADQITGFRRIAVDHATHVRRRVDLGAYVGEILASLELVLQKSAIDIALSTEGDLDCVSHPGAIAQIVTNLIMNTSVHARGPESDLSRRVAASVGIARLPDGRVRLSYSDDGRGMTDEVKAQAFQPFFTTRREGGGSGLGLHIVSALVADVLRGHIELETAPDRGTRFCVTFPVDSAAPPISGARC